MEIDLQKGPILIAVDGEPHTDEAIRWALDLAKERDLEIVAIHIKDPYLKQFSNEIYAQGREEYLEHVDACLDEEARETVESFAKHADQMGVKWSVIVKNGPPPKAILEEVSSNKYSILVTGRRTRKGAKALLSKDLPSLLVSANLKLPLLVVTFSQRF